MQSLLNNSSENFLILINKLEGLRSLIDKDSFFNYRRIIFECLNLMSEIRKSLCL